MLLPEFGPRREFASSIVNGLRMAGLRMLPASGWEDHDARLIGSLLVRADLVTASHPVGCVQLRLRRGLRPLPAMAAIALVLALAMPAPYAAGVLSAGIVFELIRGWWRTGPLVRRAIHRMVDAEVVEDEQPPLAIVIDLRDRADAPFVIHENEPDLSSAELR